MEDFLLWQTRSKSFQNLAAFTGDRFTLTGDGRAEALAARIDRSNASAESGVGILRQSRRLCGCWPLKGALAQPLKAKARTTAKTPNAKPGNTPGIVKLLLPPRQSRGARFD